jgi:hypothetical protein
MAHPREAVPTLGKLRLDENGVLFGCFSGRGGPQILGVLIMTVHMIVACFLKNLCGPIRKTRKLYSGLPTLPFPYREGLLYSPSL